MDREMQQMDGYVVSKTNSKSLLSFMNQMVYTLEYHTSRARSYETIPQDWLEDLMMEYLHGTPGGNDYTSPLKFWKGTIESPKG
jgi:hypothetical protein